jgi:predicted  nucleic acid-binding Zn-ribbon protein
VLFKITILDATGQPIKAETEKLHVEIVDKITKLKELKSKDISSTKKPFSDLNDRINKVIEKLEKAKKELESKNIGLDKGIIDTQDAFRNNP